MRIESLLPVVLLTLALAGCQPANPVLDIEGGKIQGVESTIDGVYIYKGIPFAAPPVGDLRWKEPQPVIPWEGVKVADTFGPGSVQVNHDSSNPWTSEFYWEDPEFSEDSAPTPAAGGTSPSSTARSGPRRASSWSPSTTGSASSASWSIRS